MTAGDGNDRGDGAADLGCELGVTFRLSALLVERISCGSYKRPYAGRKDREWLTIYVQSWRGSRRETVSHQRLLYLVRDLLFGLGDGLS